MKKPSKCSRRGARRVRPDRVVDVVVVVVGDVVVSGANLTLGAFLRAKTPPESVLA